MEQINYIYALVDPNTNKVRYIGKTNNMKRRYNEHLNRSKDMKHHSSRWIQSLLHKNQKPIHISIGEYPDSIINIMEIFWINFYNTTYGNLTNHTIGGDGREVGYKCSDKTKQKCRENKLGVKSHFYGKLGKDNHQSVKVNQYNKDGKFIKTWESISDVQRELGIQQSNITRVCSGKGKTAGKFGWRYTDES